MCDVWCMMYDVCMYDVWCMMCVCVMYDVCMYDVWCMMYECMMYVMYDVWCMIFVLQVLKPHRETKNTKEQELSVSAQVDDPYHRLDNIVCVRTHKTPSPSQSQSEESKTHTSPAPTAADHKQISKNLQKSRKISEKIHFNAKIKRKGSHSLQQSSEHNNNSSPMYDDYRYVWCMMYDVWCVLYDVWCMMYDAWCMMCDVWCMYVWCVMCDVCMYDVCMYDVWCMVYGVVIRNKMNTWRCLVFALQAVADTNDHDRVLTRREAFLLIIIIITIITITL